MQAKTWLLSIGIGMAAGAAAILMVPKHSQLYQMADDAAHTIKMEAGKMLDSIRKD